MPTNAAQSEIVSNIMSLNRQLALPVPNEVEVILCEDRTLPLDREQLTCRQVGFLIQANYFVPVPASLGFSGPTNTQRVKESP